MIADDGEVVKIRMHCNEVGADTCHWLTLIRRKHPLGLFLFVCFVLSFVSKKCFFFFFEKGKREKEDRGGNERPIFVGFVYCTQAVMCVLVCRC